jgi:hypothetical protein
MIRCSDIYDRLLFKMCLHVLDFLLYVVDEHCAKDDFPRLVVVYIRYIRYVQRILLLFTSLHSRRRTLLQQGHARHEDSWTFGLLLFW